MGCRGAIIKPDSKNPSMIDEMMNLREKSSEAGPRCSVKWGFNAQRLM